MAREPKLPIINITSGINRKVLVTAAAVGAVRSEIGSSSVLEVPAENAVSQSYLNTPVIDNLQFVGGSYTDFDNNQITYPSISIDTVLFEVNLPKNIIKTAIQGRSGTIKEYVSDDDYQISCTGKLSNRDNLQPTELIRDFRAIMEVPQQLPVISGFLNEIFEIFNIVITDFTVSQSAGKRNEVDFSFKAISDVALGVDEI